MIGVVIAVVMNGGVVDNDGAVSEVSQEANDAAMDGWDETEDAADEVRTKIEKMEQREKAEVEEYEAVITGRITHQAVEEGKLSLRVAVEQAIDGEGACKLMIRLNGVAKYTGVKIMEANSNYYSCAFDVPLDDFARGEYEFEVCLMSDSQSGSLSGGFVYE